MQPATRLLARPRNQRLRYNFTFSPFSSSSSSAAIGARTSWKEEIHESGRSAEKVGVVDELDLARDESDGDEVGVFVRMKVRSRASLDSGMSCCLMCPR